MRMLQRRRQARGLQPNCLVNRRVNDGTSITAAPQSPNRFIAFTQCGGTSRSRSVVIQVRGLHRCAKNVAGTWLD